MEPNKDPRVKFSYVGSDTYTGFSTGTAWDVQAESFRKGRLTPAENMTEQHYKPEKQLRTAMTRVLGMGVLPYHKQELGAKGEMFVCWDCNLGGIFKTLTTPRMKQPKGFIGRSTTSDPMQPFLKHRSSCKRHKGKNLPYLLDMTGHEKLPIKGKIEKLLEMAAARQDAGKTRKKAAPRDPELAEATAEADKLEREVKLRREKLRIQKAQAELAEMDGDPGQAATAHSVAESA